ncbi:MAG: ABC transporter substrate-binding protein [Candidatus Hadarchaeaceae archaeon]
MKGTKKVYTTIIVIIVAAIVITSIFVYSQPPAVPGRESIVIAIEAPAVLSAPYLVADELGYFDEQNLDVTFVTYGMAADTADAVMSGLADFGHTANFALLFRLGKGDLVLIGSWWRPTLTFGEFFVKDEIETAADLRGKRIANIPATWWDYHLDRYLETNGLTRDDVEIMDFLAPAEELAAMARGDIDASWVWMAGLTVARELEGWHSISLWPEYLVLNHFLHTSSKVLTERRDVVVRYLKALNEASDFCADAKNWPEVAKVIEKRFKINYADAYPLIKDQIWRVEMPKEDVETLQSVYEWGREHGYVTDEYDVEEKFDIGPLKEAIPAERITWEPT